MDTHEIKFSGSLHLNHYPWADGHPVNWDSFNAVSKIQNLATAKGITVEADEKVEWVQPGRGKALAGGGPFENRRRSLLIKGGITATLLSFFIEARPIIIKEIVQCLLNVFNNARPGV
jgi:hypothetical protein